MREYIFANVDRISNQRETIASASAGLVAQFFQLFHLDAMTCEKY